MEVRRKMRYASLVVAFLLVGCAAQPYKTSRPAPTTTPDAIYSCALNLVNSLGYTMEQANKDSGFFKAERSQRKGPSSIHWGETINEELTVVVLSGTAPPTLQVTAAANSSSGRNQRMLDPTKETKDDADRIVASCAK